MKNKLRIKKKMKKINKFIMKHKIIRIKITSKQKRTEMQQRKNFNLINKIINNKFYYRMMF